MKKILIFLLCYSFYLANSQTSVLQFDGIDDYVDLGSDAGNGIRTIEFWFKLDEPINSQLSDFVALIARDISNSNNTGEFYVFFQPSSLIGGGKLRFDINGTQPFTDVLSDNDSWNKNQWYHVAAVVHPVDGMMLFVDGIKQQDTDPYNQMTSSESNITTIGCWGQLFNRHFSGQMDDVRFSSDALYNNNFTPWCPDILRENSTIGLWNFPEGSGTTTADSSGNGNNAILNGTTWSSELICLNTAILSKESSNTFTLYPTPSKTTIFIDNGDYNSITDYSIKIFNSLGQEYYNSNVNEKTFEIDISSWNVGIYYLNITNATGTVVETKRIIKQ
jgi:hypothetical protein